MKHYQFGQAVRNFCIPLFCFSLAGLTLSPALSAEESSGYEQHENRKEYWSLLGGYGISHKDLGKTKVQVQVLDFVPRYERVLFDNMGSSWYRGHHSLLVELPVTWVFDPDTAPMVGVNILGAWTFTASQEVLPYFFGGGGIVYTDADIPGLGSAVNGNWQLGAGVRFKMAGGYWMNAEYRFHHISNTGAKDPNDPINSSKFLLGITF